MKILIVEDSSILAKIISTQISNKIEIDIEVHIASSMQVAKELIEKNHYVLALLDLHLPDAEGEEIVDFFIEKEIASIVMTASIDKKLQDTIAKKKIVDYVLKNRSESIDYIIHVINRTIKNRSHKVLVVDDSTIYRKEISFVLNTQLLNTITVNNGQEALEMIRKDKEITLVVTDYHMPVVNGLELVLALRKSYKKDELPIIGMSSEKDTSISFLKYGANDFMRKPFFKEEFSSRVNNTLESIENIQKLHSFANTDFLTGVANRKYFYNEMRSFYKKNKIENRPFAVAMIDIDFFKKVNDTYGHDAGDEVIKILAKTIKDNIKGRDIVARFGGEEFCVVLKDIDADPAIKFFESLREKIASLQVDIGQDNPIEFTISIGVATKFNESLDEMVKESDKQLYIAKNSGRNIVCCDKESLLV
jgi:diguanylate cyclase (GGDEF)-like protein